MHFPKIAPKSDLIMGFVAASVVLMSGLAMSKLSAANPEMAEADLGPYRGYVAESFETVTQNAIAADARTDLPAIAAIAGSGASDASDVCPVSLELMDEGNAMIGATLLAPCLPDQDLVIAHAGMVYTAKTLATGALFFSLPALKTSGDVDIRFTTGDTVSAQIPMPDAAKAQRVVVQWPYADGFAIHAFENGAGFGQAGHIWQENPTAAADTQGGYLTVLGDASVQLPLMAQVYTYGQDQRAEVLFEVAVTETTCGGEMMGDVISAVAGAVTKSEMTLAMPGCDALGEYVHVGYTPAEASQDLALVN
jgi:hypothetical protein